MEAASSLSKSSIYISLNKARGSVGSIWGGRFGAPLVKGRLRGKGANSGSGQGSGGGILARLFFGIIY